MALIGARDPIGRLSPTTMRKQAKHHPELTPEEYASAQDAIDRGQRHQDTPQSLIYILAESSVGGGGHVLVVKATKKGDQTFVTSFRRLSRQQAERDDEISRLLKK